MTDAPPIQPAAFITLTLHAHLPYVINHGTWPHGLEWLLEATAETYLPLLRILGRLERDGIALNANLNLSPILLEQLAHPVFKAELPLYLERKILSAREDEALFLQTGEPHFAETARFWQSFYIEAQVQFAELGHDIIRGFRHFHETGSIEIITCAATHGYMPLLGTDESCRAQIEMGVRTHQRHLGLSPRGIWVPECGYRPDGWWHFPVLPDGYSEPWRPFHRIGVEQALAESGLDYFFVDTHLVADGVLSSPYELRNRSASPASLNHHPGLYHAYTVAGPYAASRPVSIFPRDPRTSTQVWSGDSGYPGDSNYLDFHKKRWPGGHRYWQVTGSSVDMADKTPYDPAHAAERIRSHAEHYVSIVCETLAQSLGESLAHSPQAPNSDPPVLASPFDAELFGHWWFEGILWLEQVARIFARPEVPVKLITGSEYLDRFPPATALALPEGSWGKNGSNEVWLNPETSWTWTHIYPAEAIVRDVASSHAWRDSGENTSLGRRILQQLCRELLLMESSDWQFLITTAAAADYAEQRFLTHVEQFRFIHDIWQQFHSSGAISIESESLLSAIELRDSIFPDLDPALWARR